VEYLELPPPPWLDHMVHCFWFLRGAGGGEIEQTLVPDGRTEIVLHLREPFSIPREDGSRRCQARSLAAGQLIGPLRLVPSADAHVVGIRFRTEAASLALGAAVTDLTGQVVPLAEVRRSLEARLMDAAASVHSPAGRVVALSKVLADLEVAGPTPLVRQAVAGLEAPAESAGRVGRLARRLGTSPRTLERRVRDATGLSPRALAAVVRFRRAFRRLDAAPVGTWSRVAVECGYYDQAHMIREFRRFAGEPPGRFFLTDPALARSLTSAG
jgi:AraC-like DNA-binding protein